MKAVAITPCRPTPSSRHCSSPATSSVTIATWSGLYDSRTVSKSHYRIIRWYDPITARWLSNDPIGISGGLNQYVFCGDNPVNARDPSGLVGVPQIEGELQAGDVVLRATHGFVLGKVYNYTHTGIVGTDGRIYDLSDGAKPGYRGLSPSAFFGAADKGAVVRPDLAADVRARAGAWAMQNIGAVPFEFESAANNRDTENCAEFAEDAYTVGAGANPGLPAARRQTVPEEYAHNRRAIREFGKYGKRAIRTPDDWLSANGATMAFTK